MNIEQMKNDLINKINEQNDEIKKLSNQFKEYKTKCEDLKKKYENMKKNDNEDSYSSDFTGNIPRKNNIIKNDVVKENNNNNNNNVINYYNQNLVRKDSSSLTYSKINEICNKYDFNFVNQDKYKLEIKRSNIYEPIICPLIQIDFELNDYPIDSYLICLNPNSIKFKEVKCNDGVCKSLGDKQVQEFKIKLIFDKDIKCGVYDVRVGIYSKKEGRLTNKEAIIKITIKE